MNEEPQQPAEEHRTPESNLEAQERVIELFKAYQEGGEEAMEKLLKEFQNRPFT